MGINTEFLSGLGLTEEQSKAIFAERGKEIEESKKAYTLEQEKSYGDKIAEVENKHTEAIKGKDTEIAELKRKIADMEKATTDLTGELEKAKTANGEYLAKQTAQEQEKRFEQALTDMGKKFTHPAVKEKYLQLFKAKIVEGATTATADGEKTELPSDVEILTSLVGEDKDAFVGVQRVPLYGGTPTRKGGMTRDEILSMKNRDKRIKAMLENRDLFPELNKTGKALL